MIAPIHPLRDKFRMGNVVKLRRAWEPKGEPTYELVVVTEVLHDRVEWIPFNHTNARGSTKFDTTTRTEYDDIDEEVKIIPIYGMDEAIYVAPNITEYIIKSLIANFDSLKINLM